ncbi:hypothetical protein GCK72_019493 [Caenorhabditis remanei]|uniref:Uncharacterized protein n=1 Tax=Caenorhabditis remanei TaxID=31234 RepID=A0A6A5GCS0_CAERE|nr:hypothetical protein GCK72_019493 [Caenorhabditis remanei]KAF1752938.1 hypothetical protein GCK72_019493 [Caenorhabditis remanei]
MAVFIYRWKRIFTVLFIIVSFFVLFQINLKTKGRKNNHKSSININVLHSDRNGGKLGRNNDRKLDLLKNQKCTIPRLDINGSEVIHFFHTPKPLACQISGNVEEDWVFLDDEGVIRFSGNRQKAKCQMQYFWRSSDDDNNYGEMIDIKDRFNGSDFGSVTCYQGFTKWTTLLWTITDNEEAHKRARKLTKLEKRKSYNVYFLGFDSLSQMSFRRKLPRTVKFLEETLGSVVLNGYNIVGDGTPQAFIPILTGQTETELPLSRKRFPESKYLDEIYPMAWKNYSDKGYVTMFGEDMHQVATFTYRLKGFHHQPTDHYPRTFFKDVEYRGDSTCINSQPVHKIWFQNCEKFMKVYKDVPRFLLMHQGLLSHDDINLVGVEDIDLSDHLNHMNNEGIFDDSFVIVMADHGHRFAKLRETHQGQLEERMPFFSISIPKELRSTEEGQLMEKNLRENAEKLTSPFDIHASLMDILNLSSHESGFYEMQDASSERSLSVFRPIPTNRTCAQAGIEPHWCTCLSWKSAMDTSEDRLLTKRIATAVVDQFNKEISAEKDLCAPLSLSTILDAKKLIPDKDLLAYTNVKDPDGFVPDLSGNTKTAFAHYQLKIQTTPGNAIYEVTLFYDMINEELKMDFGAISHVNKYGDNPHCIIGRNFFLATFCVCFDRISSQ